jgi:Protein NO VEIN, C-terminal
MNGRKVVEAVRSEIEAARGSRIWVDYVNALKLISQVIFTRSSGFILELLQNAEDSGIRLERAGFFEVSISRRRIRIVHNGAMFTERDLRALCGIQSSKKPESGTLGYLGIGFKSVFKVTDSPEIYSGDLQFKFDRTYPQWASDPSAAPWQIIPIWIDTPSETIDNRLTTFIVPFRDDSFYELLVEDLSRLGTQLYLFLRWIRTITVADEAAGTTSKVENLGDKDGITTLRHDGVEQKFLFFRKSVAVPEWVRSDRLTQEYRRDVAQREIAAAFALDEAGSLAPGSAGAMYGGVYSFLPLGEAKSGAKFPIQADFLAQPGRDAINYEAKWNHWLLGEVADLCKSALLSLAGHDRWRFEFLPAFEFSKTPGLESYDRLFGPKLIEPLEEFLRTQPCVPSAGGQLAPINDLVRFSEDAKAADEIVQAGILGTEEIPTVLGGRPGLRLVDRRVRDGASLKVRAVDRWNLLRNEIFLQQKAKAATGPRWFFQLYLWLHRHPVYETYFYYKERRRVLRYDDYDFVIAADGKLLKGGDVSLLQIPTGADAFITDLAAELARERPMLHPDILAEDQADTARGFLTGLTGVQIVDAKLVCREKLLPRIMTSGPPPPPEDLVRYTQACKEMLGSDLKGELWILTKSGNVRAAREVLIPTEFNPVPNWETFQRFVSGVEFVDTSYLDRRDDDPSKLAWRHFFGAGGVKEAPDKGVEEFAVNYALTELGSRWRNLRVVDKRNFGYDLEGETENRELAQFEVKGCTNDSDIELTPNETAAADKYGGSFHLCVVSGIPEKPALYVVRNPGEVAARERMTIASKIWKAFPWSSQRA